MNALAILELTRTAPLGDGVASTVSHFVTGCATLLPHHAVGACVVDESGGTPIVVTQLPRGSTEALGRDPSRLFPGFADELVLPLLEASDGSTLHVAVRDGRLDEPTRATVALVHSAFSSMLYHARTFQQEMRETRQIARLQQQVIQSDKLASLGQIVAGVVHELNNPLTTIIAYSDFLKKRTSALADSGHQMDDELERLTRIGEAAERILKFSRDLVAYARPSTDVPGPVALPEVIDKAMVFCEHEFSKNGIVVDRYVEPQLPLVRGIAGQLTQVFVNLFTNAAHAMHDNGGHLEIHAHAQDSDMVIASVSDNGTGIPQADLDQIFEPFFTTKGHGLGSGLGLSIVRDIVTRHGGNLTASARAGRGTVFTLHLPVVALPSSLRP